MGKDIGTTPADFDLKPGSYQFVIAKNGYSSTNLDLTVSGTNSRIVSASLGNVAFVEALESARKYSLGGRDFDRALTDLKRALCEHLNQKAKYRNHQIDELTAHGVTPFFFPEIPGVTPKLRRWVI